MESQLVTPWGKVSDVYQSYDYDCYTIENLVPEITTLQTAEEFPLPSETLTVSLLIRADYWGNALQVCGDVEKIGLTKEEILRTNIYSFINPCNPDVFSLLTSCDVFSTEYFRMTKLGKMLSKAVVNINRDTNKTITSFEILERYHDIQDSIKKMESKTRSMKEMVEFSGDVVCQIDTEGNFTYVSPSAEAQWGYTREELLRMSIWETVDHDDLNIVLSELMSKELSLFKVRRLTRYGSRVEEISSKRQGEDKINMVCREWKTDQLLKPTLREGKENLLASSPPTSDTEPDSPGSPLIKMTQTSTTPSLLSRNTTSDIATSYAMKELVFISSAPKKRSKKVKGEGIKKPTPRSSKKETKTTKEKFEMISHFLL